MMVKHWSWDLFESYLPRYNHGSGSNETFYLLLSINLEGKMLEVIIISGLEYVEGFKLIYLATYTYFFGLTSKRTLEISVLQLK